MKILKKTGNYLKLKAMKNLALMSFCLLIFGVVLLSNIPNLSFSVDIGKYEFARILALFLLLLSGFYFFGSYSGYMRGYRGEEKVSKVLSTNLSDEYYLINDVSIRDGYGNIDHVIIGPNGVFVIETKNYAGRLVCNGDEWSRQPSNRKRGGLNRSGRFDLGSPSRQVKRNAMRIRNVIESVDQFKRDPIWVEGILVFPNPHVDLKINNPTVPILKVQELSNFVVSRRSGMMFSSEKIEAIGKEILKRANRF